MCSELSFGTVEEVWNWRSASHTTSVDVSRKKCKNCNFNSKCHASKANCKAFDKRCFYCGKLGHFPKSMNCKKYRKNHQYKKKQNVIKHNREKFVSNTNLISIKKRIMEIEEANKTSMFNKNLTETIIFFLPCSGQAKP